MLKNLINCLFLSPNFVALPILSNTQAISFLRVDSNSVSYKFINNSILIKNLKNVDKTSNNPDDIYLRGMNSDTTYRIYIDSSGDKSLPNLGKKTNDYIIANANKDEWYNHLIKGLSIDVTNYADSKDDFIKKYKAITFTYSYNFNFWTSKYKWRYEHGKYIPLIADSKIFNLNGQSEEKIIFYERNSEHHNNESAKLTLVQKWEGNILNYDFLLSVSYHWQAGSNIKHASLATFDADHYSFTSVESAYRNRDNQTETIKTSSSFSVSKSPQDVSFVDFDKEISKKAQRSDIIKSPYKKTSVFMQGYSGINWIGNTIFVYSLRLIWESLVNYDSSLLLNNSVVERTMGTTYLDENLIFLYKNSMELREDLSIETEEDMFGMKLTGNFYSTFIYSK